MAKTLGVNYRNIEADLNAASRTLRGRWRQTEAVAGVRRGCGPGNFRRRPQRATRDDGIRHFRSEANSHFLRSGKKSMRREA